MSVYQKEKSYEVIVVGGGLSGICAAIACARNGAKTAVIQNRSMFGGNASSEIRMHIVGASSHGAKHDLAETGILMEILLENKRRNPYASFPVFDSVLWEFVSFQKNLDSYLNTNLDNVILRDGKISSIICHQNTTETEWVLHASIFIDATGHGTLGVMAGSESRMGSESKFEYNEEDAAEMANTDTMGNSLLFSAVDRGEKVIFEKPWWAYTFTEKDFVYREHGNSVASHAEGGKLVELEEGSSRLPHFSNVDSGYWWIELGGKNDNIICESEDIRDELLKSVYGVWDHLKNQGEHGVENFDLDWVGILPGCRESRRLIGEYLLNENDIRSNRIFFDAVAYGGWQMDQHTPGGLLDLDKLPSRILNFEGCYTLPYRCFCNKDIPNLMMAGRCISVTKMAFGSTRVMGTCAVGGQAAGTAAALAIRHRCLPREMQRYMDELQQTLLKDDCYIPGFSNHDPSDLCLHAKAAANSWKPGCEPQQVVNGVARRVGKQENCWESCGLPNAQLTLDLGRDCAIRQIRITFDPNLTREIMPSMTRNVRERQQKGLPEELVKDYTVQILQGGKAIWCKSIYNNCQRLNVINLEHDVIGASILITVHNTYGYSAARIYEVRAYGPDHAEENREEEI